MKTITRKYKVFKFNELEEEAQDKAIENLYDVNVNYDWWDFDDVYYEIAKEYGLRIRMSEICFDLDRDNYVYFETYNHGNQPNYSKGIMVENYQQFYKKAGVNWSEELQDGFIISHQHFGGSVGKNILEDYNTETTEEQFEKLEKCLEDFLAEILKTLKDTYNGLTSKESIIDTITANDYQFLKDGTLFN